MQSWHLTFSADGRSALFPDEGLRRRAVQALARCAGAEVLLFCVVDDHVHVGLLCTRERCGLLARSLLLALRPLAGPGLAPAYVRPVEGRSHLEWLVRYCLTQTSKHGLAVHPALWTGGCFLDLAGARYLPALRLPLAEALPRLRLRLLFGIVGLAEAPLEPCDDSALRSLGIRRLVDAASAALATGPDLVGNTPLVVATRVAVAHLAVAGAHPTTQVAWGLGVTTQAVRRLLTRPADPLALLAVRKRLTLEERVRERPLPLRDQAAGWSPPGRSD